MRISGMLYLAYSVMSYSTIVLKTNIDFSKVWQVNEKINKLRHLWEHVVIN